MRAGKRGEFEASQIGEWSLYIIGFIIVLIFAGAVVVFLTQSNEDELCKLSVLSRATAPIGGAQQAVPLKCTTKKVCFTSGKSECREQFAGEKKVQAVKLPAIKGVDDKSNLRKAADIIEEVSAEKMYECWRLMGEGKLDLFNSFSKDLGLNPAQSTCVICSRLAIDKESISDELLEELGENYIDINEHLRTTPITKDSKMTYLQAFLDSKDVQGFARVGEEVFKQKVENDLNKKLEGDAKKEFERIKKGMNELEEKPSGAETKKPNRELAFVFMQIKSPKTKEVLGNMAQTGFTLTGTTFMTPVVRNVVAKLVFTPTGGMVVGGGALLAGGYGAWNAYQGQMASVGQCGDLVSNEKQKEGCSILQGLNYKKDEMNVLCSSFQGRLYDI